LGHAGFPVQSVFVVEVPLESPVVVEELSFLTPLFEESSELEFEFVEACELFLSLELLPEEF